MKHFEKWMNLAMSHLTAEENIPLGYQPTLPVVNKEHDRIIIGFYYYHMAMDGMDVEISSPKYGLFFEWKTERMIKYMEYLDGDCPLGSDNEIFRADYMRRQQAYAERLEVLFPNLEMVSETEINEMMKQWVQAHPILLQESLSSRWI